MHFETRGSQRLSLRSLEREVKQTQLPGPGSRRFVFCVATINHFPFRFSTTHVEIPCRGWRAVPSGSLSPLIPHSTCATATSGLMNLTSMFFVVQMLSLYCIS